MAKLQDVVDNRLYIPFGELSSSPLNDDDELCRDIQEALEETNFYKAIVDGLYGPLTRSALREFKEAYALTGPDMLGPTTALFLIRASNSVAPTPDNDFSTRLGTIRAIYRECRLRGLTLKSQIAYVLATVEHETADSFQPVREAYYLGSGAENYRKTLWYYPYYGRGFVQLTHEFNYRTYSRILGTDLVQNPDRVMESNVSLYILVDGMANGRFTGRHLGGFVNGNRTDFYNARRVVNWIDKAEHIANLARLWLRYLDSSSESFVDLESPGGSGSETSETLLAAQIMSS